MVAFAGVLNIELILHHFDLVLLADVHYEARSRPVQLLEWRLMDQSVRMQVCTLHPFKRIAEHLSSLRHKL